MIRAILAYILSILPALIVAALVVWRPP